jgi:hypothetical protein
MKTPLLDELAENPNIALDWIKEELGGEPIEISSKDPVFDNFWLHVVKGHSDRRMRTIDQVDYETAYRDNGRIWFVWAFLGKERVYWITPSHLIKSGATDVILSILLKEF